MQTNEPLANITLVKVRFMKEYCLEIHLMVWIPRKNSFGARLLNDGILRMVDFKILGGYGV